MFNFLKPQKHLMLATCSMLLACGFSSCTKYELDENVPEGWGESIYSYLNDQGNYTNTIRLIDDLGLAEVLAKTGSRTLFVADDEAFQRFLDKCPIAGNKAVRFEDLSKAQLKMILKGSMLNNVFQVASLSSTSTDNGVKIGDCMRRVSSMSE